MGVTTKTGDKGETSLYTGERVRKDSLRVETYGSIDSLDSALGLARAFSKKPEVKEKIFKQQKNIHLLMADIASLGKEPMITNDVIKNIEEEIQGVESQLPPLREFMVPGANKGGAMLDLARTAARASERKCWALSRDEEVAKNDIVYLNRLSDYCFLLMRLEESEDR